MKDKWLWHQQYNHQNNPAALQKATEHFYRQTGGGGGYSSASTGSGGGGTTYQSQQGPSQAYLNAQREKEEAKQKLIAAATGLAKLVADELGITAGLECFTTGDLGSCGETALNVATMFVGGLAGKIAVKYGLRWGKAAELGRKITRLGGDLIDGVSDLIKSNKKVKSLCPNPDPNSFAPGTGVVMADGPTKPIEEVDVGERVLATDPETGEQTARTVLATIIGSGSKHLVEITVDPTTEREAAGGDTGSGSEGEQAEQTGVPGPVAAGDVVIATDEHPFWVPDLEQWVDAIDLAPGTWLQTSAGTWVQVSAVQAWTQAATVHNLTVQGVHTFHVTAGDLDVLNHNCEWTSESNVNNHFDKHGEDMGLSSKAEYQYAAEDLMCDCDGLRPGVRSSTPVVVPVCHSSWSACLR